MQNGNNQQYEYQKVHQITPEELQKTLVLNLADFEETALDRDTLDEIEKDFPNISFIGSYRGGVGVSACIENALKTAEKIAKNSKGE